MVLASEVNAKRGKRDGGRLYFLLLALLLYIPVLVESCDVVGATYCIHKPDKDLKDENIEEYCDKYKEHLECVYSKYKGCDKREKYVDAMESMIKGLRKKANQVRKLFVDAFYKP
jgi:flavorubredoxin